MLCNTAVVHTIPWHVFEHHTQNTPTHHLSLVFHLRDYASMMKQHVQASYSTRYVCRVSL